MTKAQAGLQHVAAEGADSAWSFVRKASAQPGLKLSDPLSSEVQLTL